MKRSFRSREALERLHWFMSRAPVGRAAPLKKSQVQIPRTLGDAGDVRAVVYRQEDLEAPLPIVIYLHGGGYALSTPEAYLPRLRLFHAASPCVFVAPDYRRTLEAPFPAGHDDCYDVLCWVHEHARELGGDPDRLILAGDSAGGGLTTSTALRARDLGGPPIAMQVPLYPMIDDREERWLDLPDEEVLWTMTANRVCWDLLLGEGVRGGDDVSEYAAPARAEDVSGLPPTLCFIGARDIFLSETRDFIERLDLAGVSTTFRVFDDAFHGQEFADPRCAKSREINAWFYDEFARLVATL